VRRYVGAATGRRREGGALSARVPVMSLLARVVVARSGPRRRPGPGAGGRAPLALAKSRTSAARVKTAKTFCSLHCCRARGPARSTSCLCLLVDCSSGDRLTSVVTRIHVFVCFFFDMFSDVWLVISVIVFRPCLVLLVFETVAILFLFDKHCPIIK